MRLWVAPVGRDFPQHHVMEARAGAEGDRAARLMYIYIVTRTQIYLTEEIEETLKRISRQSGRSKSQLIRDAVARVYLAGREREDVLNALRSSAGAWRGRASGKEYAERLRRGRLGGLHRERGA